MYSEDQIMDWFVQIVIAIKYIHERNILHRDLKPRNIFLTQTDKIKIGDFGITKELHDTNDCS